MYTEEEVIEIIELTKKISGGLGTAPKFILEQYEKQRHKKKDPIIVGCY